MLSIEYFYILFNILACVYGHNVFQITNIRKHKYLQRLFLEYYVMRMFEWQIPTQIFSYA